MTLLTHLGEYERERNVRESGEVRLREHLTNPIVNTYGGNILQLKKTLNNNL